MFNNFKHRFGEKSKRAAALLAAAALLCGLTGCSKSETGSSAPLSSLSVPQSVHANKSDVSQNPEINPGNNSVISTSQSPPAEESKAPQSSEVNSDNTSSSGTQSKPNIDKSEFDFDEAVKNITLFGSKVSLPCTIKDLGEDFSLDNEIVVSDEKLNIVSMPLLYKGKMLGMVNLKNCKKTDLNKESKQIILVSFGDEGIDVDDPNDMIKFWQNPQIDLNIQEVNFLSSYDDILYRWGKPNREDSQTSKLRLIYEKDDLAFENSENYVEIDIIEKSIVSIIISVCSD